jgi:uncharacterized protein YqeY
MATLQERLNDEWKAAMRSGDTLRRDTLSGLRAAIKNEEIQSRTGGASGATSLDDVAAQRVIEREAKKRRDAIEEYEKASRPDRAAAERDELRILQEYLPQQMSDEELETLVRQTIDETGASGGAAIGAVMKTVMPRVQGRADGKRVNEAVRRLLS